MSAARLLVCRLGFATTALLLCQCDKIPKFQLGDSEELGGESGGLVRDVDATEFDQFTAIKNKLVVVDFHADWCGPCKSLGPKLESLAEEFDGRIVVGKINVDNAKNLAARLGVSGIPDVRIFRNGTEVDRFVGDIPRTEIRTKLDAHAVFLESEDGGGGEGGEQPAVDPIKPMTKDWMPEGIQKR